MNLFDGKAGITNGTIDGVSHEIVGTGGDTDVFVSGEFDGATVTLQRFSKAKGDFMNTGAVWKYSDELQGLVIKPGERYRLSLVNTGSKTDLIAETN